MHSNVQQPEPEKPKTDNIPDSDVIVVQPITKTIVERPPYNTVMVIKCIYLCWSSLRTF